MIENTHHEYSDQILKALKVTVHKQIIMVETEIDDHKFYFEVTNFKLNLNLKFSSVRLSESIQNLIAILKIKD